jgi:hypothetical protein
MKLGNWFKSLFRKDDFDGEAAAAQYQQWVIQDAHDSAEKFRSRVYGYEVDWETGVFEILDKRGRTVVKLDETDEDFGIAQRSYERYLNLGLSPTVSILAVVEGQLYNLENPIADEGL